MRVSWYGILKMVWFSYPELWGLCLHGYGKLKVEVIATMLAVRSKRPLDEHHSTYLMLLTRRGETPLGIILRNVLGSVASAITPKSPTPRNRHLTRCRGLRPTWIFHPRRKNAKRENVYGCDCVFSTVTGSGENKAPTEN
jgi:hypothetical protein